MNVRLKSSKIFDGFLPFINGIEMGFILRNICYQRKEKEETNIIIYDV